MEKTKLKYVSKGGTVRMGYYDRKENQISIISIIGLGLPAKEYETMGYAGQSGITTIGSKDMPRTITISCDVYSLDECERQKTISDILKAFYYPGTLYVEYGMVNYAIDCKVKAFDDPTRNGTSCISNFTVQLECDYPYFRNAVDSDMPISIARDLINGTFKLPCVWTEFYQQGNIYNDGDLIYYPIIDIRTDVNPTADNAVITIENVTTGAFIKINHVMRKEEIITINLKTRRIISNIDGNITNHITDDTVLENFYLDFGGNEIIFDTSDENQELTSVVTYNSLHLTAVR